jgi:pyruvate dehydrogenase E2 component (dihydrolipoamide acetyltransferase)
MSESSPILVSREIVNADTVFVVAWLVADGERVEAGTEICEIDTSKAVETIEAERDGFVRQSAAEGDEIEVGGVLGYLTEKADTPLPKPSKIVSDKAAPQVAARISAKARRLIEELRLDVSLFAGRGVVRESDVRAVAEEMGGAQQPRQDPRGPFHMDTLSAVQRRVARVMEQSVAAIPASYLERIIDFEPVRKRARNAAAEWKTVVSEVDLLVAAVAEACVEFPHFNAFVTADDQLHVFDQVNVGLAVDVEGDLYVVVVKSAATKSPLEIAKELRGLQYLALRRRLEAKHLAGGTITVTSMIGRGIHRFQPIPYPQQAAIVSIADPDPESDRAALGIVFDHRIANGTQASQFLAKIGDALLGA